MADEAPASGPLRELAAPVAGACLALSGLGPDSPPGAASSDGLVVIGTGAMSFWAAGEPPPLPSQPELPVDLLLRLLPVPSGALGGSRLIGQLEPIYERLR